MITVSNRRKRGNKPLPADIAARTMYAGRPGPFGNPFGMGTPAADPHGREITISKFEHFFTASTSLSAREMRHQAELLPNDAILECWCVPLACHAQVIADYENRRRGFIQ